MARHTATTPAVNTDTLSDITLWIRIDIPRYIRVKECELAMAVINAVNCTDDELQLNPKDILGVQFMSTDRPYWIVNLSSRQAKAMVLAADSIQLEGKQFKISDFSTTSSNKKQQKDIRLSIHGIPQNVPDTEVESWVKGFASLASPIFRHKSKDKGTNNQFDHLLTGHRFCYVSTINEHKERYSSMAIPDPLNVRNLIDIEITLYYNGQPESNCRYCHSSDHLIAECPVKPRRVLKCFLCGEVGHVQNACPDGAKGPKCFKCSKFGHKSFQCHERPEEHHTTSNMSKELFATPTATSGKAAQASALAQELIDHCLSNTSDQSKSPELLNRVKALLNFDEAENVTVAPKQKAPKPTKKAKAGKQSHPIVSSVATTTTAPVKAKQASLKDYARTVTKTADSNMTSSTSKSKIAKRKLLSPTINSDGTNHPDKRDRKES